MNFQPGLTFEQKQETVLAFRELLEDRMHNLVEFAHRHGFKVKVGGGRGMSVILGKNNFRFIHGDLR